MIVIGLTGSIAMGKSTVGAMMQNIGIPVHESDHAAHEFLRPDSIARPAIAAAFPYYDYPDIYDRKTKNINRKALGALIFNDDFLRNQLEKILHPLIKKSQIDFIRSQTIKGAHMTCLDIPLLFETGAEERVDYTITVSAPYTIQRARVLDRPHMDEEKFHAILERQMPDREKCRRSDYVIKTGIGRAHTLKTLKEIISDIHAQENQTIIDKKIAQKL